MQHLFHRQNDLALLLEIRVVFVVSAVAVNEPAAIVTVNTHLIRHQRIQPDDVASTVPDDLRISVAVDQQMRHQCFPEHERCHFRIRLVVQQKIKRVLRHSLFSAVGVLINVQGKLCDCLRQNSHAGVNCDDLHCRAVVDSLACVCPPEEIAVGRAVVAVLRLIPRPEQSAENAHVHHSSR